MGYWENRQAQMMYEYMKDAEAVSQELADLYAKASRSLNYRIDEIYDKFKDRHNLSDDEAVKLLNTLRDKTDIEELKKALAKDPKNAGLLTEMESGAYRARIERLEQLQAEIDRMMQEVYNQEKKITTRHYADLASNSYYREIYNVQRQVGFQFSFSAVDPKAVSMVLNSKWSGANYSERIWKNTQGVADNVKEQMLLGLLTGKTEGEMAREIANKYATGAFEARRLVRTESNFVSGQMQLSAYEECGAEQYEFVAVLDLRTSEICRSLDGKVFYTKDAQQGVNMNPMHPFCRSTTIIHLGPDVAAGLKRRARDPVSGENKLVPADMNYRQWYEKNVANNPKAQAAEKMILNKSSDQRQWEKYKNVIGQKAGKSLAAFQDIKYNEPEKWQQITTRYKDTKLSEKLRSDKTNKTILSGKQGKHLMNHNNYTEGRSYLYITEQQAQELVNQYAGTGRIIRSNSDGKWQSKEKIVVDRNIGRYINKFDGTEEDTNAFMISYSKGGVHIIPARRE